MPGAAPGLRVGRRGARPRGPGPGRCGARRCAFSTATGGPAGEPNRPADLNPGMLRPISGTVGGNRNDDGRGHVRMGEDARLAALYAATARLTTTSSVDDVLVEVARGVGR